MKNGATPSGSISSQRFGTRGRAISRCRSASPSTSRCVQRGSIASIRFGRSTATWCPTVELMRSWKAAGSAAPWAEGVRLSFCAAPEGHDPRVWQGRRPSNVSPCTGVRRFSLSFCAGCSASPTTSPRPLPSRRPLHADMVLAVALAPVVLAHAYGGALPAFAEILPVKKALNEELPAWRAGEFALRIRTTGGTQLGAGTPGVI
jgi:hypothetical protein